MLKIQDPKNDLGAKVDKNCMSSMWCSKELAHLILGVDMKLIMDQKGMLRPNTYSETNSEQLMYVLALSF